MSPRFSFGLFLLVVMFGIYLPSFGISLIAVKLLEKAVLCRIPGVAIGSGFKIQAGEA